MVSDGRNDERAAGRHIGLERLPDGVTDEFLHSLFIGRAPSAL
jgi:hypothetical protein